MMAKEGGLGMLIKLLHSPNETVHKSVLEGCGKPKKGHPG